MSKYVVLVVEKSRLEGGIALEEGGGITKKGRRWKAGEYKMYYY